MGREPIERQKNKKSNWPIGYYLVLYAYHFFIKGVKYLFYNYYVRNIILHIIPILLTLMVFLYYDIYKSYYKNNKHGIKYITGRS